MHGSSNIYVVKGPSYAVAYRAIEVKNRAESSSYTNYQSRCTWKGKGGLTNGDERYEENESQGVDKAVFQNLTSLEYQKKKRTMCTYNVTACLLLLQRVDWCANLF